MAHVQALCGLQPDCAVSWQLRNSNSKSDRHIVTVIVIVRVRVIVIVKEL